LARCYAFPVRASGKISLSGLVFLAVVSGVVYGIALFAPLYVDNLDVKEAVLAAHNLANRVRNDGQLRLEIRNRTMHTANHYEEDGYGGVKLVKGLGLKDEQIIIERNPVTQNLRIEVNYERQVQLKPTQRVKVVRFSVVREGPPPP
jgi:hypothetical protein